MADTPRKKSPRAPSMALDEALERAIRVYDKDRLHPLLTEVMAQRLGYKSDNNGAALSAIASLRYFGLLERPSEGTLAISRDVETYRNMPDGLIKQAHLRSFLKRPALYAELIDQFPSGLPSDANLRQNLIARGFSLQAADVALASLKRSFDFAGYFYPHREKRILNSIASSGSEITDAAAMAPSSIKPVQWPVAQLGLPTITEDATDRIPVRLPGGRRAWLLIPTPFFEADKVRVKAQIDLLLTQDEEPAGR